LAGSRQFPWLYPYAEDGPRRNTVVLRPIVLRPIVPLTLVGSEASAPLGQRGFLDRFTVTMGRTAQRIAVEDWDAFDDRFGIG
jgi:hypothetical protein